MDSGIGSGVCDGVVGGAGGVRARCAAARMARAAPCGAPVRPRSAPEAPPRGVRRAMRRRRRMRLCRRRRQASVSALTRNARATHAHMLLHRIVGVSETARTHLRLAASRLLVSPAKGQAPCALRRCFPAAWQHRVVPRRAARRGCPLWPAPCLRASAHASASPHRAQHPLAQPQNQSGAAPHARCARRSSVAAKRAAHSSESSSTTPSSSSPSASASASASSSSASPMRHTTSPGRVCAYAYAHASSVSSYSLCQSSAQSPPPCALSPGPPAPSGQPAGGGGGGQGTAICASAWQHVTQAPGAQQANKSMRCEARTRQSRAQPSGGGAGARMPGGGGGSSHGGGLDRSGSGRPTGQSGGATTSIDAELANSSLTGACAAAASGAHACT